MESVLPCDYISVAYLTGLHFIMWAVQKVNTWDSYMWTISVFSGASHEEIRSSYKRLALKWHPDKHNNSQEATKVNC